MVHGQQFIVRFVSENRSLIRIEDRLVLGMLLLQLNQLFQYDDVHHAVSAICGNRMRENFTVPAIRVQRQFIVVPFK